MLFCTGLPLLYVGLAGFLLTIGYPWLKYKALGDIDIFLTYSLLPILGTSYVAIGEFNLQTLWLSVPIGLITVAILHVNNLRDIGHDKRAGIRTFAMLLGGDRAVSLYCFELLFPFAWVMVGIICGVFPWWTLLVLIALKPAIDNAKKALAYRNEGVEAVMGLDEQTAKLQLIFSLMLFAGTLIAAFL
jgi:1,4-dihydroxy-2-naphthoate octaprenyltransferase